MAAAFFDGMPLPGLRVSEFNRFDFGEGRAVLFQRRHEGESSRVGVVYSVGLDFAEGKIEAHMNGNREVKTMRI